MTQDVFPIIPPPELLKQWVHEFYGGVPISPGEASVHIATQAARWGADQELEACCEWLVVDDWKNVSKNLHAARRPKPPSLKEQALTLLDDCSDRMDAAHENIIRRAIESLPD